MVVSGSLNRVKGEERPPGHGRDTEPKDPVGGVLTYILSSVRKVEKGGSREDG